MKIALIGTVASSLYGFRADLIRSLILRGHSVYALAIDYDDAGREKVKNLGAIPIDYNFNRTGMNPFADIYCTYRLRALLKQLAPDLTFSYFSKPVVFGTLAAYFSGVKRRIAMIEGLGYTFTEHPCTSGFKIKLLRKIQIFLYRISFPITEHLIFLNPDDPIDLLNAYSLRAPSFSVLGGIGLNLADYPFSIPAISPITFIFVGRLLAEKGVNDYIKAAKLVKAQYPDAQFVLLGGVDQYNPGSLSPNEIEQLINDNIIIYPGHVNKVSEWLAASSVFVLPSYYREGVPRSSQEALAIGRPIITTDVPGCRETVINGKNGFLIPKWRPDLLAEKMIYFIENPSKIVDMGKVSRQVAVDKFDAEKVNTRLIEFLGL